MPMIRKFGNCRHYIKAENTCSLFQITHAYNYDKVILLQTGYNLYCGHHEFYNEETLRQSAMVVEYKDVQEAMQVINSQKQIKEIRNHDNIIND